MSGFGRHAAPQPSRPGSAPIAWRAARLRDAGFEATLAERLAEDRRWDVHALLELVDRGCPPELAARILAPLQHEGSAC